MGNDLSGTRLYDRNFAVAFASQTCFVLGNTLLAHYARWITLLGGDERHIGWILGLAPTVSLLLRPWVGPCIDRLGVRKTWVAGQILVLVTVPANLCFDAVGPGIFLLRMLTTFGFAVSFASSLTYVTQSVPAARMTEAIGVYGASGFVAMLVGPALGDVLLGDVGRTRASFVRYFAAIAAAVAGSTALLGFVRAMPTTQCAAAISLRQFLRTARAHWPGSILLVCVAFGVCMTIPFGFLAKFADDTRLPGFGIGVFFACYAGWGLLLRLALRDFPDRLGRRKVLLAGLICYGGGLLAFLGVDSARIWQLVLAALMCGSGHALLFHTMVSLALEPFPAEARGTGSVLALMHLDLGQVAGAPILGQVAYHLGYDGLFLAAGLSCFAASMIYGWSAARSRDRSRGVGLAGAQDRG